MTFVSGKNRREFIREIGLGTAAGLLAPRSLAARLHYQDGAPWYRKAVRWGQTNINEMDPTRYDISWWREHWKRTRVQGLVINAGGIVAYYPSRNPLQHRAEMLGDRDLFGELSRAAHEDGLYVFARMDSNRAHEDFYSAHKNWFAHDLKGQPYRAGDLYISCISSPYYDEYIPEILREVIERYQPEGFTDNSWSGLDRDSICHCDYCSRRFFEFSREKLPHKKDWEDPAFRKWIEWNYERRNEIWRLNNRVTRSYGGRDCIWVGMIGGNMAWEAKRFRDALRLGQEAEMMMFDDQSRNDSWGFQSNAEMGKRMHDVLGWHKLIPESMATYQRGPTFRKAAAPPEESRMWMIEGIAGTIQLWWHHVGAYQEDRRQFQTAEPIFRWHEKKEEYLINRIPVATVGVVWSRRNIDFFGQDEVESRVVQPYRGICQALVRSRIPFIPIHIDHIPQYSSSLKLLILANIAAISDAQIDSIRLFVERGGSLVATGKTGLLDHWGDERSDFGLADLLGVRLLAASHGPRHPSETDHSYLRLSPDVGRDAYGPLSGTEPAESLPRHPTLKGFETTNILPFGGQIEAVEIREGSLVPITLVPDFPIYPPETSWMRKPRTDIPALVLKEKSNSRTAYLPADVDRRYALHNLPDHGNLLENIISWAHRDPFPLRVQGRGLLDCHLYRQSDRLILHLVNLTSSATWRAPIDELVPVGPFEVELDIPDGLTVSGVRTHVSEEQLPFTREHQTVRFSVKSVLDHELVVLS